MKIFKIISKAFVGNMFCLKWLAYTSFVLLFLVIPAVLLLSHFQIDIVSSFIGMDNTTAILKLIGLLGLANWITVVFHGLAIRSQFDRYLAHANLKRLFYILLLVNSTPCILYLVYIIIRPECYSFCSLRSFNDNIIDPFLNHENFGFAKSLISLLGTFLLSGLLVSMLVSFVNQRAERWEKGELYYNFQISNYRIVIGGHDAVPSLARKLVEKYKSDKLVIFTNRDIPSFRREVESCLEESQKERVIIYHGYRNSEADLKKLYLGKNNLKAIYVLGESRVHGEEETSHDTLNMSCLSFMNELRGKGKERIDCYVFFEHQTTSIIFQKFANNQKYYSLNFIPYNFYELQAQKAIGWDCLGGTTIRLDRFGDNSVNADKHVHLIIVGMSKMGQALGLEAIRVCHYPNYAEAQMQYEYGKVRYAQDKMKHRRTKITFIDCNMKEILDSFRCVYERLLDEIQWSYIDYDCPSKSQIHCLRLDRQKIVPDIELEFVNGRIQSEKVINHLIKISNDSSAVLTIASCLSKSNLAIASILCLPKEILEKAEILIYQPDSTKLVESIVIKKNYNNVCAFGEISEAVNLDHIVALETMAQRVNNVYLRKRILKENCKKENSTEKMTLSDFSKKDMRDFERENEDLCNSVWTVKEKYEIKPWEMTESTRWSNRYHASAIWQKIPYVNDKMNNMEDVIRVGISDDDGCVEKSCEGLMARIEHNRWCIERWLLDVEVKNSKAFYSYKALAESNNILSHFPTNDQIMTMAIPYIVHGVINDTN